jgi:hypothetical protein
MKRRRTLDPKSSEDSNAPWCIVGLAMRRACQSHHPVKPPRGPGGVAQQLGEATSAGDRDLEPGQPRPAAPVLQPGGARLDLVVDGDDASAPAGDRRLAVAQLPIQRQLPESSPTGSSSPRRLAGRPHHRRRSHGTLRTRGAYPCPPSSECLPWSLRLVGPVGRTNRGRLAPLRGSGARLPQGARRAIVSCGRRAFLADLRSAPPAATTSACPGCHPAWYRRAAPVAVARDAVG